MPLFSHTGSSKQALAQSLWSEYAPVISRQLASYEADHHLQQDLAQAVFLAILTSIDRILKADNQRAYVFRIVHNVAVDHISREARIIQADESVEPQDVSPSPEQSLYSADDRERLLRAVRRLKLPYRQVVVLVLEDLDYADIADILGISEGNVRIRLNRAKDMLRQEMNHDQ